jgi:ribosomal protein S18 acetylase RimI-like enzyme
MLAFLPAKPEQYDDLFQLMLDDAADYLNCAPALMQLTREQFAEHFRTVGQVYGIYQDAHLVGFMWVEERPPLLYLHGLVVRSRYQGQGMGSAALQWLINTYRSRFSAIELGVHQSNVRARTLYERTGYQTVAFLDELGFYIMQRPLSE